MEYIQDILRISFVLFVSIVTMRIYMAIANYIGEKLGMGQFFIGLFKIMKVLLLKRGNKMK